MSNERIAEEREALKNEVPIWRRYSLTVEEAALYFNIGRDRLRSLLEEPDCNFGLNVGNKKKLIKREKLEKYLDNREWI